MIDNRKDAAAAGESKYNTGKPCVNGHLADRYTTSGTCSMCIRDSNSTAAQSMAPVRMARQEMLIRMAEIKVRIFTIDKTEFFDVVHAMAKTLNDELTLTDVVFKGNVLSGAAGTGVYRIRCANEHIEMIRDLATAFRGRHKPDIDAARRHALGYAAGVQAEQQRDNGETPWTFT